MPVFFIHSQDDEIVPIDQCLDLYESATTEKKEFWVVPGTHHIGAYFTEPTEYTKRIISFFDRNLGEVHCPSNSPSRNGQEDSNKCAE